MRKRKWLIIVVAILLLINLLFFVVLRFVDVKASVAKILTERLGSKLNADIDFKGFNFTTKFIQISDIKIHNIKNKYNFSAKQLYFEYKFWNLVIKRFNITKAIKKISCFSPTLSYNFQPKKIGKVININEIESILRKLSYVSIINGNFNLISEEELSFNEVLTCVEFKLEKDGGQWKIDFSAEHPNDKGKINISGVYEKDCSDFNIILTDFEIPQIIINQFTIQNGKVNLNLPIKDSRVDEGILSIDSLLIENEKQQIFVKDIKCKLYENELFIDSDAIINWQDYNGFVSGSIINYLTKDPEFNLKIRSKGFDIGKFNSKINGVLAFEGKIKDKLRNYRIELNFQSPSMEIYSQNVKNLYGNFSYQNDIIDFHSGKFIIENNPVNFFGNITINKKNFKDSEINIKLSSDRFRYPLKNLEFEGDVIAQVSGNIQNPGVSIDISELELSNQPIDLNHFVGKVELIDNKLTFTLRNIDESIILSGQGNNLLISPEFSINLKSNNLSLNELCSVKYKWLNEFKPNVTSDINISINSEKIDWKGFLYFLESPYSLINGNIILSGNLPIKSEDSKGMINLYSDNLYIRDKKYTINCTAKTHVDSIFLKNFSIDDALLLSGKFTLPIINKDPIYYKGLMKLTNLSVNKLYNILSFSDETQEIFGNINGKVKFASDEDIPIFGNIQIDGLLFDDKINPLDAYLSFDIKDTTFNFNKIKISNNQKDIFDGYAKFSLNERNLFTLYGKGNNVNIHNDLLNAPFYGIGDYEIYATGTPQNPRLLCNINLRDGKIFSTKYDTLSAQFFQDSEVFYLNNFEIVQTKRYDAAAKGSYSYNFFKKQFYDKPDEIVISANGDFLSIISEYIDDIKQASSKTKLHLILATEDKKTVLKSGEVIITKGEMQLKGQPERLRKINLYAELTDNRIDKLEGSVKIGDGKLFILNGFEEEIRDINIGGLNLGTVFLTTDEKGVSIHIPEYMTEKALVDLQLKGFEDEYFRIYKEDDAFKFSGKILLANGKGVKPPGKMGSGLFDSDIPIHFDFDLVFKKNIWYIYTPLRLYIDHNDFISFRTNPENDKTKIFFDLHSHRGEIQLFGETFKVDNVEIKKSKFDKKIQINANFKKKTPDGSTIYLSLTSTEKGIIGHDIHATDYGNYRIKLHSDNPKDETMLSILSKLHYGKSIGELTEEEKSKLYREGAIKIASDELGNLLVGPLLMPVESTIRQFLGLDFFRLKTGFMGNIMRKSGLIISEEDFTPEPEHESQLDKISELSKDIILENLSVTMGKYITPNWYVNYEALLQKELTSSQAIKIGVQHEITFRYELPYNFDIKYMYRFSPIKKEEIQRISLESAINF